MFSIYVGSIASQIEWRRDRCAWYDIRQEASDGSDGWRPKPENQWLPVIPRGNDLAGDSPNMAGDDYLRSSVRLLNAHAHIAIADRR